MFAHLAMNESLSQRLKAAARQQGFQLAGICPAVPPPGLDRFRQWLRAGYDGQMSYLADRREAYAHPRHVMDGVRSVVMLAMVYETQAARAADAGQGRVSRYAWGPQDYHDVIHQRLKALSGQLREWCPDARIRGVVDTAPLLEREFAQLAGLGWIGKNTMLINPKIGSWFFLAALLTDVPLEYDPPHVTDHCGTCRACLDACPTDAFPEPYVLDATRCISYLTIELRDGIPDPLRSGVGNWVFGCDICQDVCPWNRRSPVSHEDAFQPTTETNPIDLIELLELDDDGFRKRFRATPLWRSRRRGILRNAAIVLGNQRHAAAVPALTKRLTDQEPLIRDACRWALERIAEETP